jgi:hypothetical protein
MSNQYLTNINVDHINSDDRTSLERLLGGPLVRGQQVFICVYTPEFEPDSTQKANAAKVIESVTKKAQENIGKQQLTNGDVDAAVDEAIVHVRQRK